MLWRTVVHIIVNRKKKVRWGVVQDTVPQKSHSQGSIFSNEVPFPKVSVTSKNNISNWGLCRDIKVQTLTLYILCRRMITQERVYTCSLCIHFIKKIFYEGGLHQKCITHVCWGVTVTLLVKGKKSKPSQNIFFSQWKYLSAEDIRFVRHPNL